MKLKINPEFPGWLTANFIIRKIASNLLDIYVFPGKYCDDVFVQYVPNNTTLLIPAQNIRDFRNCYGAFMAWADITLDVENCVDQVLDQHGGKVNEEVIQVINARLRLRRFRYDRQMFRSFESVFLDLFGVYEKDFSGNL